MARERKLPPKPVVLGVAHEEPARLKEEQLALLWRKEKQLIYQHLAKLPQGAKVGIEISPARLAVFGMGISPVKRTEENSLQYAVRIALKRGLAVVPLDSDMRFKKHVQIGNSLDALELVKLTMPKKAPNPKAEEAAKKVVEKLKKVRRNVAVHAYTRSIGMGSNILQEKPPLNIVALGHAEHLAPVLQDHRFIFSPLHQHYNRTLGAMDKSVDRTFSDSGDEGLRQKLEARMRKTLYPPKKRFE